jgi:hypothetical protein
MPMTLNQSNNKRSIIELIAKIIIGLVVAAFLAAIFIILIVRLPTHYNTSSVALPQVCH